MRSFGPIALRTIFFGAELPKTAELAAMPSGAELPDEEVGSVMTNDLVIQ
jgi:hypothetical protein